MDHPGPSALSDDDPLSHDFPMMMEDHDKAYG